MVFRPSSGRDVAAGALTVTVALFFVLSVFVGTVAASESFTNASAGDVEIGQTSTTHDVTFDIDLATGETTHVQIDTSNLPGGASLQSPISSVSSDNANVDVSKVGVTGSVANVSVANATGFTGDPGVATIAVTLELDTSGTSSTSSIQYSVSEDGGSTLTPTVNLVDTTAPTYDSVRTGDSPTGDSSANDTVTLNVTEAGTGINASTVAASDFTVDGGTPTGASVATVNGQPVIRLTLGTPLATDATPTVDLTGSFDDSAGNTLSGTVSKTASDGLSPVISTATYNDTDGDGQVDQVNVTYSEAISGSYTDGDWSIATAGTVSLSKDGTGSFSAPSVLLDVTGSADTTGGSTAPQVQYTGTTITDTSGNANAAGTETVAVDDEAAPVNVSVEAKDTDSNGQIDRIDVTYSEDVSGSSPEAGDYTLGGTDAGSVSVTGTGVSGSAVQLTVSAPSGNTDLDLTLSYDATAGTADSVTDGSNPATGFSNAPVTDSTAPSVSSATVLDRDGDGAVDAVNVTFSESIDDSTITPADFAIGGNATDAVDTLGTADDDTIQLRITTAADEVNGTDAKDLTYSPGSAADLAGNSLAAIASGDLSETDGASPILSDFQLAAAGSTLTVTFNATETLGSATVEVTGPESGSITTFTTSGSTHEGTLSVGSNGEYTATVSAAADSASNAASTGQSDTASVSGLGDEGGSDGTVDFVLSGVSSRESVTSDTGLTEVSASFDGTSTSTINVEAIAEPDDAPTGTFVTGVEISVASVVRDSPATLKFAITRERLSALDIAPESLTAYRLHDGAWQPLETSYELEPDRVIITANTPGFSQFAVMADGGPSTADDDDVATTSTSTADGSATREETTSDESGVGTTTAGPTAGDGGGDTQTDGMPGFTALAALLALIAVVGAALRRS